MSFKGEIEAQCPKGCEPFTAEVWSFIRGDQSPALRDTILARECNLLLCDQCDTAFIPPEPYVYFEPQAEILAFVFPESDRAKESFWRQKMHDDFLVMGAGLGPELSIDVEPEIFFGLEELAELLEKEDYLGEEREVMEFIAKDLGLSLYQVSPRHSRQNGVPRSLPFDSSLGKKATRESVIRGLEKLIAANDALTTFGRYLEDLKPDGSDGLPPPSTVKPR